MEIKDICYKSLPWFMYTPDKLKSYFKDRSLLQSSVYLTKDKSETLLHLVIKILSKDAAKIMGLYYEMV